jgi:hypothetical protein
MITYKVFCARTTVMTDGQTGKEEQVTVRQELHVCGPHLAKRLGEQSLTVLYGTPTNEPCADCTAEEVINSFTGKLRDNDV